jgi:hypothetical protein
MSDTLYREATSDEALQWKKSGAASLIGVPVEIDYAKERIDEAVTLVSESISALSEVRTALADALQVWQEAGIGGDE